MSIKELTDEQILEHLKNNTILRNSQLSVLIKLLNSLKEASTLAIDGAWGSGKTVFVKQLRMLADEGVEDYGNSTLDNPAIEELRKKQKTFYFNAWENDYLGDALGAILLRLIADSGEGLNEATVKRGLSMINPGAAIKKVTFDLFDPEGKPKKDTLIEHIKPLLDRHGAVSEFVDQIKGDKKRIVFIIDELDRCKPSFAVDLLEVIKHYFVRDDITFIVTANLKELSHTVKKYYGYEFDGYAYLNKFFDLTIGLTRADPKEYAKNILDWNLDGFVYNNVAHDAIRYYEFEMREINAYFSSLRLISRFLNRNNNYRQEQHIIQLIFVPIALALKIRDNNKYYRFISGKGQDVLSDFLSTTNEAVNFIIGSTYGQTNEEITLKRAEAIEKLLAHYSDLFSTGGRRGGREDRQDFDDAVSLISSYATIPEEGER